MWNKRKGMDTDFHEEKRYQFIREQVRPQKKVQAFLLLKRLGILVVTAFIFGGIAGGCFVFVQNHFRDESEEVVQINTYTSAPTPAPTETSDPTLTGKDKRSGKKELTLSDINQLSKKLSSVGTNMDSAIVGVMKKEDTANWLEQHDSVHSVVYGMIFGESGKYYDILTTCETIQKQPSVYIQLMDDTMVEGEVLGSDAQLNLAVVRIKKGDIGASLLEKMTVAKLGTGFALSNGTNLVAVGCPDGILHSVFSGRVTNNSIYVPITDGEIQVYCTDIPYSEDGNGFVLDVEGQVIGIITTAFKEETGTTGMAFIKLSHITALLGILQNEETIPYIGIEGRSLDESVAKAHNLEAGAYLTEVYSGAPAYEAGLRVADVITQINGQKITGMADIYNDLLNHKSNDKVIYTVHRKSGNGRVTKQIRVTLG